MKVRIGNHVLLPLVLAASLVAGEQASLSESEGPGSVVENEDPSASSHDWKYTLVFPMVWAPSIDGSIERVGDAIEIKVPFSDIFDSLAFGFMGEFSARKGRWAGALKIDYLYTENETITEGLNGPVWGFPIAPSHRIETQLSMAVNDVQVQYEVNRSLSFYTGIRDFFTRMKLKVTPLGTGLIEIEQDFLLADDHLFDWVVGFSLRQRLGGNWVLGLAADTRVAGQNDVDFLINGLVYYRISDLNSVWFGYRFLQIGTNGDELVGTFDTRFTQQGPTVGWAFTF